MNYGQNLAVRALAKMPILCDCYECHPERGRLHREAKRWLRTTYGDPVYDWKDLQRQEEETREANKLGFLTPLDLRRAQQKQAEKRV